jgi:anti-sigma28 factor (negative regulator of flagellin synthesis)
MGVITMLNNSISSAVGAYSVTSLNQTAVKKPERPAPAPKTADVFTFEGSDYETHLSREVSLISSGVRNADDSSRAEQIAAKIQNGTYNVPAEDIARAILGI